MLLAAGVSVNQLTGDRDFTPLMIATHREHGGHGDAKAEIMKELIRHGADVNAATAEGFPALFMACSAGDLEAAAVLLNAGADPNQEAQEGAVPYWIACQNNHVPIVSLLSAYGAKREGERWEAIGVAEQFFEEDHTYQELLDWLDATESWSRLHHLTYCPWHILTRHQLGHDHTFVPANCEGYKRVSDLLAIGVESTREMLRAGADIYEQAEDAPFPNHVFLESCVFVL